MDQFSEHRPLLFGLAYRLLGSACDADDVVQEAYLRWRRRPEEVRSPRAFLSRVVTRLCIDRHRTIKARRESYIGTWLPEPVCVEEVTPLRQASLSPAFLLVLERLGPVERAAFILREIFELDYAEIADVVERTQDAVRQLVSRARARVKIDRARHAVAPERQRALAAQFFAAARTGDLEGLITLLREDARVFSDGGGVVAAARNVIEGRERIARFIAGTAAKFTTSLSVLPAPINGLPGVILERPDRSTYASVAIELDDAGAITAVYIVRNPEKLGALERRVRQGWEAESE